MDGDITIALVQFDGTSSPSAPIAPPMGGAPHFPAGGESYGHGPQSYGAQPGFVPPPYPTGSASAGVPAYPPQPPYSSGYSPAPGAYPPSSGPYPPQHGYPVREKR